MKRVIIFIAILLISPTSYAHSQDTTPTLSDYFGVVTIRKSQSICLNFNNLGPSSLIAKLQFFDTSGNLVQEQEQEVATGQAASLTYTTGTNMRLRGVAIASAPSIQASDFVSTMETKKGKNVLVPMTPIRKSGTSGPVVAAYIERAKVAAGQAAAMDALARMAAEEAKVPLPRASAAANKAEAAAARAENAAARVCAMIR